MKRALFVAAVFTAGCHGIIGDNGSVDEETSRWRDCSGSCAASSTIDRLTRERYSYAITDLFGSDIVFDAELLPEDSHVAGFPSNQETVVSEEGLNRYMLVATEIANDVVAKRGAGFTAACESSGDVATCVMTQCDDLLRRAYRRTLSLAERRGYRETIELGIGMGGISHAVYLVVQAMLQSPSFLYRFDRVGDDTRLDDLDLAVRLALFLWSSAPDNALLDAAESGELSDPEAYRAQVRRLMDDSRFMRTAVTFHRRWLKISVAAQGTADEATTVTDSLAHELDLFVTDLFASSEPTLGRLLTSTRLPVNATLAEHYGLGDVDSAGFTWMESPHRAGVLSMGTVLSANTPQVEEDEVPYTRAIHRGLLVLGRLLCTDLTAPDDVADQAEARIAAIAAAGEEVSTRERLDIVTAGSCQSCHASINGIGYAFETFDNLGRYSEADAYGVLDPHGELLGTDVDGPFDDLQGLAQLLAKSDDVAACTTKQWLRFALGRSHVRELEDPSARVAHEAFVGSGLNLRVLIEAIATSEAFSHRTVPSSADSDLPLEEEVDASVLGDVLTFTFNDGLNNSYGTGPDAQNVGAVSIAGRFGSAMHFADTNHEHLLVPKDASLFTGNTFTLEAWVYRDRADSTSSQQETLFGDYEWVDATTPELKAELEWSIVEGGMRVVTNGACGGETADPGQVDIFTTVVSVPSQTWTHLAVSWNGADMRFYVNGRLAEDVPLAVTPCMRLDGSDFVIGSRADSRGLAGVIDELKLSSYAKTEEEIAQSMEYDSSAP